MPQTVSVIFPLIFCTITIVISILFYSEHKMFQRLMGDAKKLLDTQRSLLLTIKEITEKLRGQRITLEGVEISPLPNDNFEVKVGNLSDIKVVRGDEETV